MQNIYSKNKIELQRPISNSLKTELECIAIKDVIRIAGPKCKTESYVR